MHEQKNPYLFLGKYLQQSSDNSSYYKVSDWTIAEVWTIFKTENADIAQILKKAKIKGNSLLKLKNRENLMKELFKDVGVRLDCEELLDTGIKFIIQL